MALQDYNWGAIIIGAAAITALVAATPSIATAIAGSAVATSIGASLVGGVLGHWASKITERGQEAIVAAFHR